MSSVAKQKIMGEPLVGSPVFMCSKNYMVGEGLAPPVCTAICLCCGRTKALPYEINKHRGADGGGAPPLARANVETGTDSRGRSPRSARHKSALRIYSVPLSLQRIGEDVKNNFLFFLLKVLEGSLRGTSFKKSPS